MKVPYNWLREYVDVPFTPKELADRLTMAGIEVGTIELFAPLNEYFVSGRLEDLFKHPQDDNLQVARVNCGDRVLNVVCGARNIAVGRVAAVALPGAILPGGKVLKPAEIKGVMSEGMLCSPAELGLDLAQNEEGVLLLDDNCFPGKKLSEILFVNEPVLELDLTPNRADCLGLLGVAREVAALTGNQIKLPPSHFEEEGPDINNLAEVEVLEPELCTRYTARIMENICISPSPLNIQLRLLAAGIRPINNIVDVTNYVMLETGQPMHAFDLDKLGGRAIVVRRAYPGEKIVTLDGVERNLDPEVLVIADKKVPVGLAGVMGGENTEITQETTRMFLEAACFDSTNIRKTSRKLNLPSEASLRFEKGVDPEGLIFAQNRAVRLMQEIAGGVICRGIIDCNLRPYQMPKIFLRQEKVEKVLGYRVSHDEIEDILKKLGLEVKIANGEGSAGYPEAVNSRKATFTVKVPSHRRDLTLEVDLIEEIARLKGYENIPATLPEGVITSGRPAREKRMLNLIVDTMVACGLHEVITFSFMNPRTFDFLELPEDDWRRNAVKIMNPLTEDQGVMRTTLLPNLLQVIQYNFNRQVNNHFIFELGKVFYPQGGKNELPLEKNMLALAVSGRVPEFDWQTSPRPVDFYYLKGIMEALLKKLGIKEYKWKAEELPLLHPTRGAELFINGKKAGFLGALHPALKEKFEFKQDVYLAEVSVEHLLAVASTITKYKALPRYPAVLRDLAFIVSEKVSAGEILDTIRDIGGELLENVHLFDVYQGKQIPEKHVSLAFSLTFRHKDRTLQDEEVDELVEKIEETMSRKYKATLRKQLPLTP